MRVIGLVFVIMLLSLMATAATNTTTVPGEESTTPSTSLSSVISAAMSNPQTAVVMLIEFIMGFALGYTAMKALKYILAFIGILILGSALSVWSIGSNFEDITKSLGAEVKELLPLAKKLLATFSFVVMGPVSIGFIL
jgi:uncharacterized membrane protein (Fun14 family)